MATHIIGIDLGTTNTAVSFLPKDDPEAAPQLLPMTQVTEVGEVGELSVLPSFLYLPDAKDYGKGTLDLPWAKGRDFAVGAVARKLASSVPGKTISSAKSWLCAPNIDPKAAVLPWNRNDPERQTSPVDAAARYLQHISDVWDHLHPDDKIKFARQEIILTVPASFDAAARDLTVKAAKSAGLSVTLLEEPQAAFYAWLQEHAETWRDLVVAGDRVLVCDIGGGTTDFSLIQVNDVDGEMQLERIAVGKHILLGGDNMDLALAYGLARRLQEEKGTRLDAYQIAGLTHACREAKERLCSESEPEPEKLTVLGRGSSVVGGAITVELSFEALQEILVDGFFPLVELTDHPQTATRTGLRAFGLDYEAEPAITKHLAAFLSEHSAGKLPRAVLFNGGVSKAQVLKQRVVEALQHWHETDDVELQVLAGTNPDLAVATGACWYGNVRSGNAIRIKAGSPHSYYVGVESTMPAVPGISPPLEALCVTAFGMEEGSECDVPYTGLGLLVGETTEFRFFAATNRKDDKPGQILPDVADADLQEIPALAAELEADKKTPAGTLVPVCLRAVLSEIGTLQLWCLEDGGRRKWKLEYELRQLDGQ